jgi:hypothetical protein
MILWSRRHVGRVRTCANVDVMYHGVGANVLVRSLENVELGGASIRHTSKKRG